MKKLTKKLLPYVHIEDIPEDYKELAEDIGIENFFIVASFLGGSNTYLPNEDYFLRILRDKFIKQEFNGHNYRALAIKYELSETRVRQILKGEI